jgi:hypothetical protein
MTCLEEKDQTPPIRIITFRISDWQNRGFGRKTCVLVLALVSFSSFILSKSVNQFGK